MVWKEFNVGSDQGRKSADERRCIRLSYMDVDICISFPARDIVRRGVVEARDAWCVVERAFVFSIITLADSVIEACVAECSDDRSCRFDPCCPGKPSTLYRYDGLWRYGVIGSVSIKLLLYRRVPGSIRY